MIFKIYFLDREFFDFSHEIPLPLDFSFFIIEPVDDDMDD